MTPQPGSTRDPGDPGHPAYDPQEDPSSDPLCVMCGEEEAEFEKADGGYCYECNEIAEEQDA